MDPKALTNKKVYKSPQVTRHGTLARMTLGGGGSLGDGLTMDMVAM